MTKTLRQVAADVVNRIYKQIPEIGPAPTTIKIWNHRYGERTVVYDEAVRTFMCAVTRFRLAQNRGRWYKHPKCACTRF